MTETTPVYSGAAHYFRTLPEQWSHRLRSLHAMGLDTVETYLAWNVHEPVEGDWRRLDDIERYLDAAAEEGLRVIVRPGPYICAEWDNGGLPSWLTARAGRFVRTAHPVFLEPVRRYLDAVVPRFAGHPALSLVQVENEYGSFGTDAEYLAALADGLRERGVTVPLVTSDGPTDIMLTGGTVPGIRATVNFGSNPASAFDALATHRPDDEPFCMEFWNGWFDHWGERHHVRSVPSADATLGDILDAGGSVSLYMAHGGTNFGLWAGANHDGRLQPTITSYDSDAPIAEHGAVTAKFHAFRSRFVAAGGRELPVPADPVILPARSVPVVRGAGLLPALGSIAPGSVQPTPPSFEELGIASGLVLYAAKPRVPLGDIELSVRGLHDRAQVFIDGEPVGVLDGDGSLPVRGTGARVDLRILVENQGRINYGPLLGQGKGILGGVQLGRRLVHGWTATPLALDEWTAAELTALAGADAGAALDASTAGFSTARFVLGGDEPADAFLALPGFGKGFVWVNGFLLGRYWEVGPQTTLYVPAPVLEVGVNTITVLELLHSGTHLEFRDRPELGPSEEYVETF
ncbi:MAG: beta-galactosidase [Actinobacteria bacterium]|nr:beta-galactosidase [Actinomycetota bacterium]